MDEIANVMEPCLSAKEPSLFVSFATGILKIAVDSSLCRFRGSDMKMEKKNMTFGEKLKSAYLTLIDILEIKTWNLFGGGEMY